MLTTPPPHHLPPVPTASSLAQPSYRPLTLERARCIAHVPSSRGTPRRAAPSKNPHPPQRFQQRLPGSRSARVSRPPSSDRARRGIRQSVLQHPHTASPNARPCDLPRSTPRLRRVKPLAPGIATIRRVLGPTASPSTPPFPDSCPVVGKKATSRRQPVSEAGCRQDRAFPSCLAPCASASLVRSGRVVTAQRGAVGGMAVSDPPLRLSPPASALRNPRRIPPSLVPPAVAAHPHRGLKPPPLPPYSPARISNPPKSLQRQSVVPHPFWHPRH